MSRPLPPLNSIRAFEAASRHLSLSRAAEELGVTQGAISKQVILLEDYIGAQLFERAPAGLTLTNEGGNLKEAIRPAFVMLGEAFARYSRRSPHSSIVRISTLSSFASQFLVPRLDSFRVHHPEIELVIMISTRLVDFSREEIDIGVRYGSGDCRRDGAVTNKLVEGQLVPVCTPDLLARAQGDVPELLGMTRRIQHASFNEWTGWSELAGVDISSTDPILHFEDFVVALRALMLGQGIALLPEILVRDHLASGELVEFSPVRLPIDSTYHIAHDAKAERRPATRAVIQWLKAEAARSGVISIPSERRFARL